MGVDEEPQPFQIVKVAAVARHPNYIQGNSTNDLALLVLREKLRMTGNVGSVCLTPGQEVKKEKCIITGWGKDVLQGKGLIIQDLVNTQIKNVWKF